VHAVFYGKKVGGNPFGAASLEWQSSSPPSFHNFDHKIHMNDPYDFSAMVYDEEMDTYVQRDFIDKPTAPVVPEPSKV